MNNYERIKQMSVDEMAEFISDVTVNCEYCRLSELCSVTASCLITYKQWLLQECE